MMRNRTTVSKWLQQIGNQRGVTLFLGEDGHCVIPCVDGLNCIVEVPAREDARTVFIYIPLIALPELPAFRFALIEKALELNLFGLLTGGSHVALDARSGWIALTFSILIEVLDETTFNRVLSDMFKVAPNLRFQLQTAATQTAVADRPLLSDNSTSNQAHLKRLKISIPNP